VRQRSIAASKRHSTAPELLQHDVTIAKSLRRMAAAALGTDST
jgi:hypothetical protein